MEHTQLEYIYIHAVNYYIHILLLHDIHDIIHILKNIIISKSIIYNFLLLLTLPVVHMYHGTVKYFLPTTHTRHRLIIYFLKLEQCVLHTCTCIYLQTFQTCSHIH